MLQAFVFERVGVVVGDLYFLDPNPHPGPGGAEHGVRLELQVFRPGRAQGNDLLGHADRGRQADLAGRSNLLESVDGKPGSFNRTHHHQKFTGWDPGPRVFLRELSADPLGWLAGQLADLPAVLERAGVPKETADPGDADSLQEIAFGDRGRHPHDAGQGPLRPARRCARRRRGRQDPGRLALTSRRLTRRLLR